MGVTKEKVQEMEAKLADPQAEATPVAPVEQPPLDSRAVGDLELLKPVTAAPVLIRIEGEHSDAIESILAIMAEDGGFANLHHLSPGGFTILVGDQGDITFNRR